MQHDHTGIKVKILNQKGFVLQPCLLVAEHTDEWQFKFTSSRTTGR